MFIPEYREGHQQHIQKRCVKKNRIAAHMTSANLNGKIHYVQMQNDAMLK